MPTFSPSQSVTARATLPVKPAGIACKAELYLGAGKVATSGKVPFTSTGADQQVILPITMPSSGTYPVLLDITTDSLVIGAFYGTEDVVVAAPAFTYGSCTGQAIVNPQATAWKYPNLYFTILNQSPSPVTHTMTVWRRLQYDNPSYSPVSEPVTPAFVMYPYEPYPPYGKYVWDTSGEPTPLQTTIPAGGSKLYHFNSAYRAMADDGQYYTFYYSLVGGNISYYYWVRDELGNKSPEVGPLRK